MTELEKAQERLKTAKETFDTLQHAATHDRKYAGEKHHTNGHYVKALEEIKKVVEHETSMVARLEKQAA